MVSGFNVDVRHGGKVYHVQTEDRGRRNPVIESLVYQGGRILHQERVSYADRNDDSSYSEAAVSKMLEIQHHRIIEGIQSGRFDPERRPFGEEFISARSFDECVLDYLLSESSNQSLVLAFATQSELLPGREAWIDVRAYHRNSSGPIEGAVIKARVIHSSGQSIKLPEQKTDANGSARVSFTVPDDEGNAALIVQADSAYGGDELHRLIR